MRLENPYLAVIDGQEAPAPDVLVPITKEKLEKHLIRAADNDADSLLLAHLIFAAKLSKKAKKLLQSDLLDEYKYSIKNQDCLLIDTLEDNASMAVISLDFENQFNNYFVTVVKRINKTIDTARNMRELQRRPILQSLEEILKSQRYMTWFPEDVMHALEDDERFGDLFDASFQNLVEKTHAFENPDYSPKKAQKPKPPSPLNLG